MQRVLLLISILIMCFTLNASEDDQTWEFKEWETSLISDRDGNTLRYITHGTITWGHQFGFIKQEGTCEKDLLWMTWSTYEKGIEKFKGEKVEFRIEVANEVFTVGIDLTNVHPFTSDIDVALFTNFLANESFIDLLKKGDEISISMVGPPQIVEAFDLPNELFKLSGFSANHLKAVEACKDPTVLNIPPRTR
ncbi:hypothetical protein ACFL3I_05375 [Pseudomonadota bacterium]